MSETAALADLVIPATMFVEHDDFYRSYGQPFLQNARKIIDPPGQCRSNHQVICDLASRLGSTYPGFAKSEQQLISESLTRSDYPQPEAFTERHFLDCAVPFEEAHFLNGFGWPDGRFRFRPDWAAAGPLGKDMPVLPDYWEVIDDRTPQHPLRLVAAPARGYLNSTFNQSPSSRKREKKPWLKVHPETAASYGIAEGDLVKIGNDKGSVTVTAQLMNKIQPDNVVVEGIWPAAAFPENIGINVLISAEPAAPNGGAVFHDTAVWIKPAHQADTCF